MGKTYLGYSILIAYSSRSCPHRVCPFFSLKPLDFRVSCHNSSFLFILPYLSSTSTTSSVKSIHRGISTLMSLMTSSITKAKKSSKLTHDVCSHLCPLTCSNTSPNIIVHVLDERNYFVTTLCLSKAHHITLHSILSLAFSKL
jgi:hypothetical protein